MGKPHGDKTGLGYDKYTCHDPKFTNKFVKGESSFSSIHTNLPKTKCHYCGNEGHFKFECKLRKSHLSKSFYETKKAKSNSLKDKTFKPKEDTKKFKQVKPSQHVSPKIDFKRTKQVKNGQIKSINKKPLTLPPLTLEMKEILKKVERLKLKFKREKERGKVKRNEKIKRKPQPTNTYHQFKYEFVKSQRIDDKYKISQKLSPMIDEISKLGSKAQDLRWIPKVRFVNKY